MDYTEKVNQEESQEDDKLAFLTELEEQVTAEIDMGMDAIETKRELWKDRLVKYVDQDKPDDKIGVNTIYAMVNLGIAIRLADEANPLFMPRKFGDEEYAEILTDLAKFDAGEMEMSQKDYARHWDALFFGPAIRKKKGWDSNRICPKYEQADPLTWIPDPFGDYLTPFRFHYFECEILKSQMTEEYGFMEDKVDELTSERNTTTQETDEARNQAGGLNSVTDDISEDFYVSVFDGYTYKDGELYQVTKSLSGELIRAEKIEEVREEEKEGGIDMRTCVNIEWFSPLRGSATGVSMVDLIIDKQIGNSTLLNLRMIDAKFSTFGQTNLVNKDIVTNTAELTKPSINTKWIGVNAKGGSLANAVYPVPRQSIMQDSLTVSHELSKQMQLDTGISENSLGVAEKGLTLGQSQQVQANANLKLALGITISNWGERDFWDFMWLRSYEEYFESADEKIIRVANGFGVNVIEIRKDDITAGRNPDIIIESKQKVEGEREKMKVNFLAMMPYFTNDPSKPQIVKNVALRYGMKLQGVSKEMVNILTYDRNEEDAKELVHLINANDINGAMVEDMSADHQTYMVIFESARDTPVKAIAIQNRKNAYIMSGQVGLQQESAEGGMVNASQAQMTSNAISQESNAGVDLTQV